jgi:DNA-binding transcriptional LysR family regulator
MDFLQLEYFLEVARIGNMTAAANALHVAQSSVSRTIARLESDLGVPLFERSGRGIFLNDYGKAFYDRAETILRELGDGEQQLKEMRDQYTGRISISTSAARQINPLMTQYTTKHPEVLFRQRRITDMHEIKAKLDNGSLDYALTYGGMPDPEYQWDPLIEEDYFVLIPEGHRLSLADSVQISDLEGERLLMNDVDNPDFIEGQCNLHGFSPIFSFIGNEYEVIGPLTEQGAGLSIICTLALYDLKKSLPLDHLSRIRVARIEGDAFHRTLGILSRKHHYLSPAARQFYRQLVEYFRVIALETED